MSIIPTNDIDSRSHPPAAALERAHGSGAGVSARLAGLFRSSGESKTGGGAFAKPSDNVPLGILWMIGATILLAVAAAVA